PASMGSRPGTAPGAATPEESDPADSGAIRLDTARYRALQASSEGSRPSPTEPKAQSPKQSPKESQTRPAGAPAPGEAKPDGPEFDRATSSPEPDDEPPPGAS